MPHPIPVWSGVALVLAFQLALFATVHRARSRLGAEGSRKTVHVASGLAALGLPWLFHNAWPMILICSVTTVALAGVRLLPRWRAGLGRTLHEVDRTSYGEALFPVAVAALFVLAHDELAFYVIPLLVLTLADAAAAIVGTRAGILHFRTAESHKSLSGSFAFLAVAWTVTFVPLLAFDVVEPQRAALIACIAATLLTLVESIAFRGLDNLLLPVLGYAMLKIDVTLEASALATRLLLAAGLLIAMLVVRPAAAFLPDAAIASALFCYTTWALAGRAWLVAPVTALVICAIAFRTGRATDVAPRGAPVVVAMTLAALVVLIAHVVAPDPALHHAFVAAIAASLGMLVRTATDHRWAGMVAGVGAGTLPHILFIATPDTRTLVAMLVWPIVAVIAPMPRDEAARWWLRCAILFVVAGSIVGIASVDA